MHTAFVLVAATCLTGTLPGFDGWEDGYPFGPSVVPCSGYYFDPALAPCSGDELDPDVTPCRFHGCGASGCGGSYGGYYDTPYGYGGGWGGGWNSGWGYGGDGCSDWGGGWGGFYGSGCNGAYGTDWRCGTERHCCRLLRLFHRHDDCGGWHPNPYCAPCGYGGGDNCGWGGGGAPSGCGAPDCGDGGHKKHCRGLLFGRRHRHDHDGPPPNFNPCCGPWDGDWDGGADDCVDCYGGPPVAPPAGKPAKK